MNLPALAYAGALFFEKCVNLFRRLRLYPFDFQQFFICHRAILYLREYFQRPHGFPFRKKEVRGWTS